MVLHITLQSLVLVGFGSQLDLSVIVVLVNLAYIGEKHIWGIHLFFVCFRFPAAQGWAWGMLSLCYRARMKCTRIYSILQIYIYLKGS